MLNVVCGICIIDQKVLIARRSYGSSKGWFEFPGGKVEKDETKENALIREWKEELDINITVLKEFMISYDFNQEEDIELTSFICTSDKKPEHLNDHDQIVYVTPDHIYDYHFFEADLKLVQKLKKEWKNILKEIKKD